MLLCPQCTGLKVFAYFQQDELKDITCPTCMGQGSIPEILKAPSLENKYMQLLAKPTAETYKDFVTQAVKDGYNNWWVVESLFDGLTTLESDLLKQGLIYSHEIPGGIFRPEVQMSAVQYSPYLAERKRPESPPPAPNPVRELETPKPEANTTMNETTTTRARLKKAGNTLASSMARGAAVGTISSINNAMANKIIDLLGDSCPGVLKTQAGHTALAAAVPALVITALEMFDPEGRVPQRDKILAGATLAMEGVSKEAVQQIFAMVGPAISELFSTYSGAMSTLEKAENSEGAPGDDLLGLLAGVGGTHVEAPVTVPLPA